MGIVAILKEAAAGAIRTAVGEAVTARLAQRPPADDAGERKGLIQSRTVWGVALMGASDWLAQALTGLLPVLAEGIGYRLDAAATGDIVQQLLVAGGAVLAIIGRLRAAKRIG